MKLTLKFFANFREAVGSKTIEREFDDDAVVGDVLSALEAEYPDLDLLEDGDLRSQINVLLNGREVLHMDGIDTALEDGDTLSVFPPVAGGTTGDEDRPSGETRKKAFRGISQRLAVSYLRNLGGERVDAETDEETNEVAGDGWYVRLSSEKVNVAGSLTLTEVTVCFEGDAEALDPLIEKFSQKAMRAGG